MDIYSLLGSIFEYPGVGMAQATAECASRLAAECPEAAALLREFQSKVAGMSLSEMQELYTATFDMRPDSTTALGYHLFGDDVRRSFFMAKLKERLEKHGIAAGAELPDHLPLVLRLAECEGPGEERQALIHDGLIPGLSHMIQGFGQGEVSNPYRQALDALLIYLRSVADE
ncbi:MAG: nitrate reductase molybdenum cofactor assembly chaperone [Terriglobia bacterium]